MDEHYIVEVGVIGQIGTSLRAIAGEARSHRDLASRRLRDLIVRETTSHADDSSFPLKPQKIVWDMRRALAAEDIVISDVGAHKLWIARLYMAEMPNTCIISNGFAAMGIAVPGAVAAKHTYPDRVALAATGDAGFLINSQELETAVRLEAPIIVLIWNDAGYGLIRWKQMGHFGRESNVTFRNPDFVQYAQSFGAKGYRVGAADELLPILQDAIASQQVCVIDCPVDYEENLRLTESAVSSRRFAWPHEIFHLPDHPLGSLRGRGDGEHRRDHGRTRGCRGRLRHRRNDLSWRCGCVSNVVEIGGRRNLPGATKHR